jgi:hypothetical protein
MPGVMRKPRLLGLHHLIVTLFGVGAGFSRFLPSLFRSRSALIAENLFLRKQLAFYREREIEPRRLTDAARVCLVVWSRLFNWREALVIVKPETLIGWHRKGFRLFWKWKSRGGRPLCSAKTSSGCDLVENARVQKSCAAQKPWVG